MHPLPSTAGLSISTRPRPASGARGRARASAHAARRLGGRRVGTRCARGGGAAARLDVLLVLWLGEAFPLEEAVDLFCCEDARLGLACAGGDCQVCELDWKGQGGEDACMRA